MYKLFLTICDKGLNDLITKKHTVLGNRYVFRCFCQIFIFLLSVSYKLFVLK